MENTYGVREQKKGKLKINLVNSLIKALAHNHFDDIKVTDLCLENHISEVTFFKYFERKEEMLQFYMLMWNYRREVRLELEGRKIGVPGIYQLFEDIAVTDHSVSILNTLITFIAKSKAKPKKIGLSPCEMWLLSPDLLAKNPLDLDVQFLMHIQEAMQLGQLEDTLVAEDLNLLLSSLFYGSSIIAYATGIPLVDLYQNSLDLILRK